MYNILKLFTIKVSSDQNIVLNVFFTFKITSILKIFTLFKFIYSVYCRFQLDSRNKIRELGTTGEYQTAVSLLIFYTNCFDNFATMGAMFWQDFKFANTKCMHIYQRLYHLANI